VLNFLVLLFLMVFENFSILCRTEMFECLGDSDFLAKLHCLRQAFQVNSEESDLSVCLVKPKVRGTGNYQCTTLASIFITYSVIKYFLIAFTFL